MFIVNNRKIFFGISLFLVLSSILSMVFFGLELGTDFTGGSILEVSYGDKRPELNQVQEDLRVLDIGNFSLRPSGETNFVLRTKELNPEEKNTVLNVLQGNSLQFRELRFNSVGPIAGTELRQKSGIALAVVIVCIVLFITYAFRKVSLPVSSWKYGVATVIALAHDVIIPTGIYVALGHYFPLEIDLLFVTALLAILGYSVHDTIVVFDRVRENLGYNQSHGVHEHFSTVVGRSLMETMGRSINTSITLVIVLAALLLLGGSSTFSFALILLIGAIVGTYSSICVASPLLVTLEKLQKK